MEKGKQLLFQKQKRLQENAIQISSVQKACYHWYDPFPKCFGSNTMIKSHSKSIPIFDAGTSLNWKLAKKFN